MMENCSNTTLTLTIVLLMGIFKTGLTDRCSEEAQNQCYNVFTTFETLVEASVIIPSVTEEEMRLHCQEYEQAKECISDLEEHCEITDIAVFRGRDFAYKWLCETGFQEYLTHLECFATPGLHAEGRRCNQSLSDDLDTMDGLQGRPFRRKICLHANNYLDCIENAVTADCDASAAAWQREMDLRLLGPLVSIAGCILDGHGALYLPEPHTQTSDDGISSKTYIIIGCIIALSIIITAIVILMFLQIRKKRKRRSNTPQNTTGAPYVYYNNGADLPAQAVYTGSILPDGAAQAGPLPHKIAVPPPYDPLPPPSYSSNPVATAGKGLQAASVHGSIRTQPPEYRSQAGSEMGSVKSGARSNDSEHNNSEPLRAGDDYYSDVRSTRSHRSRTSDNDYY